MFHARGFTLIEVLISMVILAIGLLGLAAMQAVSLRDNLDSYNYQQATLLAYEMQDRIRANGVYWTENSSVTASENTTCDASPGCTAAQLAANDYDYWQKKVKNTLPKLVNGEDATAQVQLSASVSDANAKKVCKAEISPTHSLCLMTTWGRVNNQSSSKNSKLSDTATFYLEDTP